MAASDGRVQHSLVAPPSEGAVHIRTDGSVIKPYLSVLKSVNTECKMRFSEDGIDVEMVDPANVLALNMTVPAESFETYEADLDGEDELVVGANLEHLRGAVARARIRQADPVTLSVDHRETVVEIDREYGDMNATLSEELHTLDPASLREEPDVTVPTAYRTDMDVDGFAEVVGHLKGLDLHSNGLLFGTEDGMVIGFKDPDRDRDTEASETDRSEFTGVGASQAEFETDVSWHGKGKTDDEGDPLPGSETPPHEAAPTSYSLDYLHTIAKGAKSGKADRLTLSWSEEYPLTAEFERDGDDDESPPLYSGTYTLAPRVSSTSMEGRR